MGWPADIRQALQCSEAFHTTGKNVEALVIARYVTAILHLWSTAGSGSHNFLTRLPFGTIIAINGHPGSLDDPHIHLEVVPALSQMLTKDELCNIWLMDP